MTEYAMAPKYQKHNIIRGLIRFRFQESSAASQLDICGTSPLGSHSRSNDEERHVSKLYAIQILMCSYSIQRPESLHSVILRLMALQLYGPTLDPWQ